jgi:hypothetical protein
MNDTSSSPLNASSVTRRTVLKTGLAATALGMTQFAMPSWAFIPELDDKIVVSFLDMPNVPPSLLSYVRMSVPSYINCQS